MRLTIVLVTVVAACHSTTSTATSPDSSSSPTIDAAPDAPASSLPQLAFCQIADAKNLSGAFASTVTGDAIAYTCAQPCADWTQCVVGLVGSTGAPIRSARGNMQMQALAFVVDGMAGHFAFTPDGGDVVVTHAGSGGTSTFNPFDRGLQAASSLKTVSLGWELGSTAVAGSFSAGAGWFSRKDAVASSTRRQVARPAAAIQWVKDNFAVGHKLGTVGSSMGTIATFGSHVWYGLEPIIDYQMLIGGPGYWDVNAGCGRIHISAGYCDVDASPCTGNPMSSYGNNDPACGTAATNNCRVPTIMAPLNGGAASAYDAIINYVGATTACAPTVSDSRDASLDASSLGSTVSSWSFHGKIDFVANEGGTQPPDADQGMGEGHMLYLYNTIQSAKAWTDNEGYHHGDAWDKVPALMTAAAQLVIAGMQ
jgi:hypothetical protein